MSYRDDLKAFVDGELNQARTEEIRVAIERDPALATEVSELRHLTSSFQAVPQVEPYGLDETLRALRLAEPRDVSRSPDWRLGWRLGLGLAGAGAFLLMINTLSGPSGFASEVSDMAASSTSAQESVAASTIERAPDQYVAKAERPAANLRSSEDVRAAPPSAAKDPQPPTTRRRNEFTPPRSQANVVSPGAGSTKPTQKDLAPPLRAEPPNAIALLAPPKEQPLEIRVDSLEEAELALATLAAEHDLKLEPVKSTEANQKALVLEVPEDQAEAMMVKLKQLQKTLEETSKRTTASSRAADTKGAGDGMKRGQTPPDDVKPKVESKPGAKLNKTVRKIPIILVTGKPVGPLPEKVGNEAG